MRRRLGVSQVVIGALETGFGRSTPELAVNVKSALAGDTDLALGNLLGSNLIKIGGVACLVAAHKRNTDMVIGNVLGSNLFNIFFVLAITSMIAPVSVDGSMNRVILANLALALALGFRLGFAQESLWGAAPVLCCWPATVRIWRYLYCD
ncbi:hypothetical protein NHM04_12715 [Gilvimarinus sp. DA14]|nr:hypothetical protein NHM04_12715 [Gilvimarinus sp. DA14]